jgi:hypothetical protein
MIRFCALILGAWPSPVAAANPTSPPPHQASRRSSPHPSPPRPEPQSQPTGPNSQRPPAHPVGDHHPTLPGTMASCGCPRSAPTAPTAPWSRSACTTPNPPPRIAPAPKTIVGLWPVRMLAQARMLQDGAGTGQQPWLLSPELVSISYAAIELDLFELVARQVAWPPTTWVPRSSEWVATTWPRPSARAPGVSGSSPGPGIQRASQRASGLVSLTIARWPFHLSTYAIAALLPTPKGRPAPWCRARRLATPVTD